LARRLRSIFVSALILVYIQRYRHRLTWPIYFDRHDALQLQHNGARLLHARVNRPTVQVNPRSVDATHKPCSKSGLRVYGLPPTGRTDKSGRE
jgi:hypothetical protein